MIGLNHTGWREQARLADLLRLIPTNRSTVLDIGARDGFISREVLPLFSQVTALDLRRPAFEHESINKVEGDVRHLQFCDEAFDVIICAEVLEHVPTKDLGTACAEIIRVARHEALIGVPYKQDLRSAKTTCRACGRINPAWSHVNSFDERRLRALFLPMKPVAISFVGQHHNQTNAVASALMTIARNPYGTYDQVETCASCDATLEQQEPTVFQRSLARTAIALERGQHQLTASQPIWMHILFGKTPKGLLK